MHLPRQTSDSFSSPKIAKKLPTLLHKGHFRKIPQTERIFMNLKKTFRDFFFKALFLKP